VNYIPHFPPPVFAKHAPQDPLVAHRAWLYAMVTGASLLLVSGGTLGYLFRGMSLTVFAVMLGLAIPGMVLIGRTVYRRARHEYRHWRNLCYHCGYPLKGLARSTCPECGKVPF
jgi:hypothetical protein